MAKSSSSHSKEQLMLLLIALALLIIASIIVKAISFPGSPAISPASPDTTNNLVCGWNVSSDATQVNVSWYRNDVLVLNETNPANNLSTLGAIYTARGDKINCTVTATNGTDTTTASINTTIVNAPPSIPTMKNASGSNIENQTYVLEDYNSTFNLSSTDPDSDTVTYGSFDTLPTGSSLNANTGIFSWQPQQYVNNNANITFFAKDSWIPFANTNKFVMFIVVYVNDAPTFSPSLSNKTINESQTFNYAITAADEELNYPLNFSINATPDLPLVINRTSNTTALIMIQNNATVQYSQVGNYTIYVNITDNMSASSVSSFNLELKPINVAPALREVGNYSGTQGQPFNFTVLADDRDVNSTLSFNITAMNCSQGNPWNIITINSSQNATGMVNLTNLTNSNVVCRNVRITVIDDKGAEDSQDVFLNISNTNDPPIVEILSSFYNNTGAQSNISRLYAYGDVGFSYKVNGTDADQLTYAGDTLAYYDNTSLFDINMSSGIISFVANQSMIGNHTILITVADLAGLNDTEVMNLYIENNTAPLISTIGERSCNESALCMIVINATDYDGNNITFTSNNTAIFSITNNASQNPTISCYSNFTPNQSIVGSHSILITATDSRGASSSQAFNFTVHNTNDIPAITAFTLPTIVETHTMVKIIYADDEDYSLEGSYEYITFDVTNRSGKKLFNISTLWDNATNRTYGQIIFTPQIGDAGNYSMNFTVTDFYNATSYTVKNFTVYPRSNPPNITMIKPYGLPYSGTTVFSFTNASNYAAPETSISFSENNLVIYNVSVIDELSESSLSYQWFVNGSLNATTQFLSVNYTYFSSGTYVIMVNVSDDRYESTNWTWYVAVDDVNRQPVLINFLENLTVNGTETYQNYLKNAPATHFLDPDDDLDSDQTFDIGENSLLTYTHNNCSTISLTVTNHSLTIRPVTVSYCDYIFTASDPLGLTRISNSVRINATSVSNDSTTIETPIPTSSGGGGGRSNSAVIMPMRKEEAKPQAIELVVPDLVTVYENRTVRVPIIIQNNWNSTLKRITLNASTEAKDIRLTFSNDYFEELLVGQKRNVSLIVENYRMGEDYKIKVSANVSDPKTGDSAYVMLNTIEQSESGDSVETKVTFAQDMLNKNPECLELNELLEKAKTELQSGSREEASKMVEGVMEGCKYLVSISKRSEQKPETIIMKLMQKENIKYLIIFGAGVLIITSIIIGGRLKRKSALKKKTADEEAKKKEEDAVQPYWPGQSG